MRKLFFTYSLNALRSSLLDIFWNQLGLHSIGAGYDHAIQITVWFLHFQGDLIFACWAIWNRRNDIIFNMIDKPLVFRDGRLFSVEDLKPHYVKNSLW